MLISSWVRHLRGRRPFGKPSTGEVNEARINEARIRAVIDWIERHPSQWNQDSYILTRAGSPPAYCMAGVACMLAGFDVESLNDDGAVGRTARELLGLSRGQGRDLFLCYTYDIEAFKRTVERVTGVRLSDDAKEINNAR